jgi:hypothetical protein
VIGFSAFRGIISERTFRVSGKEDNMTDLEFESTVKRYISMLYRVAFNYLKNKEDSEDSG